MLKACPGARWERLHTPAPGRCVSERSQLESRFGLAQVERERRLLSGVGAVSPSLVINSLGDLGQAPTPPSPFVDHHCSEGLYLAGVSHLCWLARRKIKENVGKGASCLHPQHC